MQFHKRADNSSRQNSARSNSFAGNRDLHSSSPAHNVNPSTVNATRAPPPIDVDQLYDTFDKMETEDNTAMKDMFGMLLNLSIKSSETEEMKSQLTFNSQRLDRLEAKIGNPEELAVPLSLAVRNLPFPGPGVTDLQLIKAAFKEINARGVDLDRDIVKVVRQGATAENLGTVLVEMSSDETRASIMKTKKCLENNPSPGIRKLIIKNMKPRVELKFDIALNEILKRIPGGENCYIANNGHIREKNPNQRNYQNPLNSNPNPGSSRPNFNQFYSNPRPTPTPHQQQSFGQLSQFYQPRPVSTIAGSRVPVSIPLHSTPHQVPISNPAAPWAPVSIPPYPTLHRVPISNPTAPIMSAPLINFQVPPPTQHPSAPAVTQPASASFDSLITTPAMISTPLVTIQPECDQSSGQASEQVVGQDSHQSQPAATSQDEGMNQQ